MLHELGQNATSQLHYERASPVATLRSRTKLPDVEHDAAANDRTEMEPRMLRSEREHAARIGITRALNRPLDPVLIHGKHWTAEACGERCLSSAAAARLDAWL